MRPPAVPTLVLNAATAVPQLWVEQGSEVGGIGPIVKHDQAAANTPSEPKQSIFRVRTPLPQLAAHAPHCPARYEYWITTCKAQPALGIEQKKAQLTSKKKKGRWQDLKGVLLQEDGAVVLTVADINDAAQQRMYS